jgi:hypothetical protein
MCLKGWLASSGMLSGRNLWRPGRRFFKFTDTALSACGGQDAPPFHADTSLESL